MNTGKNLLFEDGEISNCKSACIRGTDFTARRLNIYNSNADALKPEGNALVEACWIHHLGMDSPDAHADGAQWFNGTNMTFKGNNFDCGQRDSRFHTSQVFMIHNDAAGCVIEGNWINGGGYTINTSAPLLKVRNNVFGIDYLFGISRCQGTCYAEWSGNTWFDGKPANGGKYPN